MGASTSTENKVAEQEMKLSLPAPVPAESVLSPDVGAVVVPGISTELPKSCIPEKYASRFEACLQATSPLTLCDTKLGPVIELGGAVVGNAIHSPSDLWSKAELHARITALIAEANPAPDTTTFMGRMRALGNSLFSEPRRVPPKPSPELREAMLQMAAFVERGREAELKEVLSQALVNTTAAPNLHYWEPNRGSSHGLESCIGWFEGDRERSLGNLACKLALSNRNTAKWLEELQGLVPGAPDELRKESAERLAKALNRPLRDKKNVWSAEEVYEKVYMDPRNLGYVSLYIVGPVPSKDAEALAREGKMCAGQATRLLGQLPTAPATITTLLAPDPTEVALHEGDHVVTEMCCSNFIMGRSFEGLMLDEMRSQLGDSGVPISRIREDLLSYYTTAYSDFSVISIGADGKAESIVPGTKEADLEIRRFIDHVETLLEHGITRDEIRAVLRITSSLKDFYSLLKELPVTEGLSRSRKDI
jgi:hypothetical protein